MNAMYAYARQQFLTGQLNWFSDNFKVVLVDTTKYTVLTNVHEHLIDIPAIARIAISTQLTGMLGEGGVASAGAIQINSVVGPPIGAIVIFHDTGLSVSSELVCYLDTGIGLPWNPQGGNVVIHWDTAKGIFAI